MKKPYKSGTKIRECRYCKNEFSSRSTNAKHCSEECYNLAKRSRKYDISYVEHKNLTSIKFCQICNQELDSYKYNEKRRPDKSKRCIDHCHVTNKVRGVLCDNCNVGLGAFKDNINSLKGAITYLGSQTVESKIVNLLKIAYERNWVTARDGNISFLDNDILYVTPSNVRKHELQPSDILKLKIVDGEPQLNGEKVSIEFKMHWLIQKYQGSGAVIHVHPTSVVASMLANIKLREIHNYFPELNRFTKVGHCVSYIFPGEEKLAFETLENIKNNDIVGLKGHGVTSRGKTLDEAFEHVERLDHCCQMALAAGAFKEISKND